MIQFKDLPADVQNRQIAAERISYAYGFSVKEVYTMLYITKDDQHEALRRLQSGERFWNA